MSTISGSFQVGVICSDWFLLDFMNIFTKEASLLKPSILETLTKNAISLIV